MFEEVMEYVWLVEHNNNPKRVLHHNEKENNYTVFGIYPYTKLKSHNRVFEAIHECDTLEDASEVVAFDADVYQDVLDFYRENFWDQLRLDEVHSVNKCAEVMVFFVNVGINARAIKALQRVLGVKVDGVYGNKTIAALNEIDEDLFNVEFDKAEVAYYKELAKRRPTLQWALKGWISRAFKV